MGQREPRTGQGRRPPSRRRDHLAAAAREVVAAARQLHPEVGEFDDDGFLVVLPRLRLASALRVEVGRRAELTSAWRRLGLALEALDEASRAARTKVQPRRAQSARKLPEG